MGVGVGVFVLVVCVFSGKGDVYLSSVVSPVGGGVCECVHGKVEVYLGSGVGRGSKRTISGSTEFREWSKVMVQCGGAGKGSSGGRVR